MKFLLGNVKYKASTQRKRIYLILTIFTFISFTIHLIGMAKYRKKISGPHRSMEHRGVRVFSFEAKSQKRMVDSVQEHSHNLQQHQVNALKALLSAQRVGGHISTAIREHAMYKFTLDQNFHENQTKKNLLKILENNKSRQEAYIPNHFPENESKKSANLQLFQKEGRMVRKTGTKHLEEIEETHNKTFNLDNPADGRASEVGLQQSELQDRIVKYAGKEILISSGLKPLKQPVREAQINANVTPKMTDELFASNFVSAPANHNNLKKTSSREEVPAKAQASCQPKIHIMFLKTHKSAGSTIQNILYRFGEANGLILALPHKKCFQLGYPKFFTAKRVTGYPKKWTQYNIMCNHLRFYLPEVKKVMPKGTFYFSIVRNPITMMESSYTYYRRTSPAFRKSSSLTEFTKNPWKYYNNTPNNHFARNFLSFDFGFDNNANYTEKYMSTIISTVETNFNLILVFEYFDESIILLKEALCWELDDVVFFKLNFRSNATKKHLSQKTIEEIKDWNALDWKLYLHFNKTLWQRIDETIGRKRMQQEVDKLRQKQMELVKTCLNNGGIVDGSKVVDPALKPFQNGNARILGYNLNPDLDPSTMMKCHRLVIPEVQYTELLYIKQHS